MIGHPILSKRVSPYVSPCCIYATCVIPITIVQSLDPLSGTVKRHLFFGLIKVFGREYIGLCLLLALRVSVSVLFTKYQRSKAEINFLDCVKFPGPSRDQSPADVFE